MIEPFLSEKAYFAVYQSGKIPSKIRAIVQSYLKRIALLLHARSFDFIFIHREAAPVGPPVIEWSLANVLKRKIIYDFDDSIWLTDATDESAFLRLVRWRQKVRSICRWSYRVSCGNAHLAAFARQYNRNVVVQPTTIDTKALHTPRRREGSGIVIGWTGSRSTLKYLQRLTPVIQRLQGHHSDLKFLVIADRDPQLALKNYEFKHWRRESEIDDLRGIDIGVMPLPNDEWTKGKCGFKALQYMALEIPAVVSPVGMNNELITHGKDGFLCASDEEWIQTLELLISNPGLRQEVGINGRQRVKSTYSVEANVERFMSLFQ